MHGHGLLSVGNLVLTIDTIQYIYMLGLNIVHFDPPESTSADSVG